MKEIELAMDLEMLARKHTEQIMECPATQWLSEVIPIQRCAIL